ncbi:MAG: hypothetical protein K1Y02_08530 [Candidatus Hydrogenedentes bacterium]|nr:hypothetical protein [Candidatus Hydrogenedentota bacterium]
MSGLGGVNPFTVSVNPVGPQGPAFRVGQVLEGVVQNTGKELLLLVSGRSVALPPNAPFAGGQTVSAEVLRTSPSLQLRISPPVSQIPSEVITSNSTVSLALAPRFSASSVGANVAQVLNGVIQQTPQGPVFQAGQTTIPLASVPDNLVGTALSARFVETGQGSRLLVWQTEASATSAPTTGRSLPEVLGRIFQVFGQSGLAERAASLIPRALPPGEAAIRLVASLFLERGVGAELVERLVTLVKQGAASGVVSDDLQKRLLSLLTRTAGSESKELLAALRIAAQTSSRSPEAALARAFAQSEGLSATLADDLRSAIHQLRTSEPFRAFLEKTGQMQEFNTTSSSLIERITANQLQNLRGLETSYLYFEPAFVPGSGLSSAHIHAFGDGSGKQSFPSENSTVVLDLSTTRLGDLWITLSAVQGACSCVFRTREPLVAVLIDEHAPELEKLLSDTANFTYTQVRAVVWNNDRLSAAIDLFRPLEGIDTEA